MSAGPPQSSLRLHLLGSPRVMLPGGEDAGLPLGKPLAALCYVAMESTRVTRDDLAAVLWTGAPETRGRQSVRQALWMLRKAAGDDLVVERDGVLELGPDVATDLDALADALAAGDPETAWTLWQGGPLQRLAVPDSPAFQGWLDDQRSRWELRMREALLARAEAESEPGPRLAWLERALEVQPYSEVLHQARIRALLEQRDVEAAEAALDEARAVVDEPTAGAFDDLAERLRALRRTRFADQDDEERLVLEFVGRAAEFSRLAAVWRTVLSGRPRSVALVGPMGIGKTRLAEEFLALAEGDGARIASVKAVETERALDLGVAGTLVRDLLKLPGGAGISAASAHALQHLVPSSGNGVPPAGAAPSPAALADAVEDLVEAVAHEVPLLLLVDDLQWVDPASRTLFLRLARTLHGARVLLLFTSRTAEGDAGVLRALRALREQQRGDLVELGPLSRAEASEMVALLLADDALAATEALTDHLVDVSAGVPLVAVELLRSLVESGHLTRVGEGWVPAESCLLEELPVPGSVQELMAERLTGLDDDERALLLELGRSPHPVEPEALAASAQLEPGRARAGLERLEFRGLVRLSRRGDVQLAHDSLRDPVRRLESGAGASPAADLPAPPAPAGSPLGRWFVLSAAALILVALALPRRSPTPPVPGPTDAPPVGALSLWSLDDRGMIRVGFGDDGRMRWERVRVPDTLTTPVAGMRTTPAGDTLWLGTVGSQERAPDLVEVNAAGDVSPILADPGDQVAASPLWSSRWALAASQDPRSERFRMDLLLVDRARGTTRTLLRPGHTPLGAEVSADGLRVVTLARTLEGPDSLVVVTPAGRPLHAVEVERGLYESVAWCGEELITVQTRPGRTARAVLLSPAGGSVTPLPLPPEADHVGAICSPDGRHVAVPDQSARTLWIVRRSDGAVQDVQRLPARVRPRSWSVDTWKTLPVGLEIVDPVTELEWGGRGRIRARAVREDGRLDSTGVTLRSLDPAVVRSAGDSVYGIRPGTGRVEVSAGDWLLDTLTLRVTGTVEGEALLVDPMSSLDRDIWTVKLGDGFARPVRIDGEAVLELGSDDEARYVDGWASRTLPRSPAGLTVELDFRLDLTRIDKQSIALWVSDADPPPPGSEPGAGWIPAWTVRSGISLKYPGRELGEFDARMATLEVDGTTIRRLPLPGFPREPGAWTRLTLQIAPDGLVSVFVDGRAVPMEPLRTDVLGAEPRLFLQTRAVDTHLYVRDLAVWSGVRYDAGEPLDPRGR